MKAAKTIFLLLWSLLVLIGGHASASFMRGAENRVWEIWGERLAVTPGKDLQAVERQQETSEARFKLTLGCVEARYYDPESGRFLSPDPLGHGSDMSLYAYCNGDPVNGLDPDGRLGKKAIGVAGAIFSTAFGGPGSYNAVNASTDFGGFTDTSKMTSDELVQHNAGIANMTSAAETLQAAGMGVLSEPVPFEPPISIFVSRLTIPRPVFTVMSPPSSTVSTTAPLLLTEGTLQSRVTAAYQQFYNDGWESATVNFNQGSITIPSGLSWETVLGQKTDAAARMALKLYLGALSISEGRGGPVAVNRRLYDPSGSGAYRIPDVRITIGNFSLSLDGTIGEKTQDTPQILDITNWSGGQVIIVTPTIAPGFSPQNE